MPRGALAAGAHRDGDPVGAHARGDEGLLAVDRPSASPSRRALQASRATSEPPPGSVMASAAIFRPASTSGTMRRLQRRAAVRDDRRQADRMREQARHQAAAAGARDFLGGDQAQRASSPACRRVPRGSRGRAGRLRRPCAYSSRGKLAGLVPGGDVRRDLALDEAPDAGAKGVDLGGVEPAPQPHGSRLQLHQALPRRDLVARPDVQRGDGAGARRAQLVLHLHRLDDDEQRAGVDRVRRARRSTCVTRPCIGASSSPGRARPTSRHGRCRRASTTASSAPSASHQLASPSPAKGGADLAAVDLGLDLAAGVVAAALGEADDPVLRVAAAGDERQRACRSGASAAPGRRRRAARCRSTAGDDDQPRQSGAQVLARQQRARSRRRGLRALTAASHGARRRPQSRRRGKSVVAVAGSELGMAQHRARGRRDWWRRRADGASSAAASCVERAACAVGACAISLPSIES